MSNNSYLTPHTDESYPDLQRPSRADSQPSSTPHSDSLNPAPDPASSVAKSITRSIMGGHYVLVFSSETGISKPILPESLLLTSLNRQTPQAFLSGEVIVDSSGDLTPELLERLINELEGQVLVLELRDEHGPELELLGRLIRLPRLPTYAQLSTAIGAERAYQQNLHAFTELVEQETSYLYELLRIEEMGGFNPSPTLHRLLKAGLYFLMQPPSPATPENLKRSNLLSHLELYERLLALLSPGHAGQNWFSLQDLQILEEPASHFWKRDYAEFVENLTPVEQENRLHPIRERLKSCLNTPLIRHILSSEGGGGWFDTRGQANFTPATTLEGIPHQGLVTASFFNIESLLEGGGVVLVSMSPAFRLAQDYFTLAASIKLLFSRHFPHLHTHSFTFTFTPSYRQRLPAEEVGSTDSNTTDNNRSEQDPMNSTQSDGTLQLQELLSQPKETNLTPSVVAVSEPGSLHGYTLLTYQEQEIAGLLQLSIRPYNAGEWEAIEQGQRLKIWPALPSLCPGLSEELSRYAFGNQLLTREDLVHFLKKPPVLVLVASTSDTTPPPPSSQTLALQITNLEKGLELVDKVETLTEAEAGAQRVRFLKALDEQSWEQYQLARYCRDLALDALLVKQPALVASKRERIILRSRLRYARPIWDIQAERQRQGLFN